MNKPLNKTRLKLTRPIVTSRQEAEMRAAEVTEKITILNSLKSDMDSQINHIRESYSDRVSELENVIAEKTECLRAWAEVNPSEFAKNKSIQLQCATIGFRTGQYQAKPIKGWTWDRVLEKLHLNKLSRYIRTKEEIDKQTLIADRETLELSAIGVRVFQEESFFLEPMITEPTTRVSTDVE